LDDKYGDPSKITDSIISGITKFRKIENDDNKRIIEFINLIERAFHDLKGVKMEQEINNTNFVSIIESKLPKNLALNWYRMIHEVDSKIDKADKFPHLMKFLITERNALEYAMVDLRTSCERKTVNFVDANLQNRCLIHQSGSHKTADCKQFLELPVHEKYEILKENLACFGCLSSDHILRFCKNKVSCPHGCGKFHHESLHIEKKPVNHMNLASAPGPSCIFPIMRVRSGIQYVNVLWDTCASVSLITEAKSKELKLRGTPSNLCISMVGGVEKSYASTKYNLPLTDLNGRTFMVEVYSIDKISENIGDIDMLKVATFFSGVNLQRVRPKGSVDVLIGYNYAAWHPVPKLFAGQLVILSNSFGMCLGGSHPEIFEETKKIDNTCYINVISSKNIVSDFFSVESLGVECQPRCGSCKCGTCAVGSKNCSLKEERELKLIESKLWFSEKGYWEAAYPWIRDPMNLPNNRSYAMKLLLSTEKRLKKDISHANAYSEQINDMVTRNVARKLSERELKNYDGPSFYITHHAVYKPTSKTTPLRIVFNSSANFHGHVLNDYLAKGPNVFLNSLFGILIRFRENHIGFMGDIKKMYNSIRIPQKDQHCHRFLWRDLDERKDPETYVITRVNMGDRPSGSIACAALRKTAERECLNFPRESKIILNSSFMDDIIDSAENLEIVHRITKNVSEMLKKVDFHIKEWVVSNSDKLYIDLKDFKITDIGSERVLGVSWDVSGDQFKYDLDLNFSKRGRKNESQDFDNLLKIPDILTKRIVLSKLNSIYDPLGLVGSFIIKGKILMRQLWTDCVNLDWDDEIPVDMYNKWVKFFNEMSQLSKVVIDRCVKPLYAQGNPILICFSDASKEAYGAVSYIRWGTNSGQFETRLLASKSRIAPVKTLTIVRLELLGAVLSKRLRNSIEKETRVKFDRVLHIVDSEIVRAMIQRESYGFNTFASTRIGEIRNGTEPSEWYWVKGSDNIADVLTRGEIPCEIGENSIWQRGPQFLKLPIEDWPIRQDCSVQDLPETVGKLFKFEASVKPKSLISKLICIERFSNYHKLLRVTARILMLKIKPYSLKRINESITVKSLQAAIHYWTTQSQLSIASELADGVKGQGQFRKLRPIIDEDGIYVVGGRAARWFEASYDKRLIPILAKDEFSRLYVEMVHNKKHGGVESDVATVRLKFWIVGLRQLCVHVKDKCIYCRKLHKKVASQKMGLLPKERLKPAPAWCSVGIDLFGPLEVKGEVNKRCIGKVYGVIFFCLPTTAVHIDISSDYSTDAFLCVFRRFVSLRGCPNTIISDSGSQLLGASKILTSISKEWNWGEISEFSLKNGIEWRFSPGDAPWWNGCCESLIRSIKKSLFLSIGEHRVTFSEMQTVCFEAANLANERPIGIKPGQYSECAYLCPNDLLLGRATSKAPVGPWSEKKSISRRFRFIQSVIDMFWKKWTLLYFPHMIIQRKWHHEARNIKPGDIVLVADKNLPRSQWKLCRVTTVEPGIDGKVRRVSLMYKNKSSDTVITIDRPVQKIVVVLPVEEQC